MNVRNSDDFGPIAVIGLGCRFPGAAGPRALWSLLEGGGEAIGVLGRGRGGSRVLLDGREVLGGFLEDIDRFDARFFGISPREAERLDPQQRILLEVAWEALEDAGLAVERLDGSDTGVFVGMWINDYEAMMFSESPRVDFHMTTGSGRYTASGRLSHLLGLRGPSVTIDTACSSSLVAVHLACQSLRSGEAQLAVAAGVNVILQPHITAAYSQSGMLSADGRCKFGDARADGYVRSEGVGVAVLKPLSDARRDGDPIHALILGSAVNNDGRTGGSLGTPGRDGQQALLRAAYRRARVAPAAVQYVEAHGTGTKAGDPVELAALGAILGAGRASGQPCLVGSIKTNIGHTEGAAGIAGLIKVALSLEHGVIPASLHCDTPTPAVPWRELNLAVATEATAWPDPARAIAGVSSFGIGGTNAHVVLAAAPAAAGSSAPTAAGEYLLPLSARSREALRELSGRYAEYLATSGEEGAGDICFTASVRRSHREHRLAVVGRDRGQLAERLHAARTDNVVSTGTDRASTAPPRVAFVFPGQGSQWAGMGRGLAEREPIFRATLERCAAAIAAHTGWWLLDELDADESRLDRIDIVQPALFAIQVALAEQWRGWGVEPAAVVGHSMGEVAAAHIAGAISLDEAARVICSRSALLRRISGRGAMGVVDLSPGELRSRLRGQEDRLSIAVCNSDRSTVVAGDVTALDAFLERLQREGVFCRRVKVDVASHSPQVDVLRDDLLRALDGLEPGPARIAMCSTVTGAPVDGRRLDAGYWMRNLRETVQFGAAVRRLREDGCDTFIEISPHPVLLPVIEQGLAGRCLALPSMRRDGSGREVMLESLGALYAEGYPVDWSRLYPDGRCVSLPSYPWQSERFWYSTPSSRSRRPAAGGHPLLDEHVASSTDAGAHLWQGSIDPSQAPWLLEHRVQGLAVLPATAVVEMALTAAATVFDGGPVRVEDLALDTPLVVSAEAPRTVQLVVSAPWSGTATFRLASRGPESGSSWTAHASGVIRRGQVSEPEAATFTPAERAADAVGDDAHYQALRRRGLDYGPAFQGIVATSQRDGIVVTWLHPTDAVTEETGSYAIHPCLLDAALQGVIVALDTLVPGSTTYVPARIDRVMIRRRPALGEALWGRAAVRDAGPTAEIVGDVVVTDSHGRVVAEIAGARMVPLADGSGRDIDRLAYEIQWQLRAAPAPAGSTVAGRWIILADRRGVGSALAERLATRGARCLLVRAAEGGPAGARSAAEASIDPTSATLVSAEAGEPIEGVVFLWGLDAATLDAAGPEVITECLPARGVVSLIKALAGGGASHRPRIILATAGAHQVTDAPDRVAVEQAALWGIGAVIATEHPDLRCTRVDLSADPSAEEIDGLARECTETDGERQIALRAAGRYVARLVRVAPSAEAPADRPASPAGSEPFRARASSVKTLDGLRLRPLARRTAGPGEIEIEVRAVGLNFRDVMSALGSLPGHAGGVGPIGMECAGRVVGVGPGVDALRVGDAVVAIAFDCLATHVIADARLAALKPAQLDDQVAATLPIAFLTASHALEKLAGMRAGERVLIHAAAGGVGLAAVQLAQRAGATVFATAGSPAKHQYLHGLGIEHVLDSRSLSFAGDVAALTGGVGVDIVLNSLAGKAVAAGLATLAPYGRFVEIGKRDIYENAPLNLGPFRSNLSYAALDLERMCHERPALVGAMLAALLDRVNAGDIAPLPVRVFPISEVAQAFRYMAEARHIGKIALSLTPAETAAAPLTSSPAAIRSDATYLITGGLGAIGLTLARWLVDAGARHLALLGRQGPGEAARRAIADLEQSGAEVVTLGADVAATAELTRALEALRQRMPELRGVIHAAGVLDDATLLGMEWPQMRAVMGAKAAGAWNLHTLTGGDPLDFFVCCSSASAFLGLAGQGNYAAANAFLDALARYRRTRGLPGLSIGWGPWGSIGLAAARRDRGERLEAQGLGSLSPDEGARTFAALLGTSRPHVAVMAFDDRRWTATQGGTPDPFFGALLDPTSTRPDETGVALPAALRRAPAPARPGMLQEHLTLRVARILRLEPARVDPRAPLKSLGLDSLMTLELRNRLEADFGLRLSATLVWNYPTIAALAGHMIEALELATDPPAGSQPGQGVPDLSTEPTDELSREQVGTLLTAELDRVNRLLEAGDSAGHD